MRSPPSSQPERALRVALLFALEVNEAVWIPSHEELLSRAATGATLCWGEVDIHRSGSVNRPSTVLIASRLRRFRAERRSAAHVAGSLP